MNAYVEFLIVMRIVTNVYLHSSVRAVPVTRSTLNSRCRALVTCVSVYMILPFLFVTMCTNGVDYYTTLGQIGSTISKPALNTFHADPDTIFCQHPDDSRYDSLNRLRQTEIGGCK